MREVLDAYFDAAAAISVAGARPGDVLLLRGVATLPDLPAGLAAVALDRDLVGEPPEDLVVGERFGLTGPGLLISVPGPDGRANAALWS